MNDLFLDEIVRPEPEPGPGQGNGSARRTERAERTRNRQRRRRRSLIALLVSLALLGGAAWVVVTYALPMLDGLTATPELVEADDYTGEGISEVEVQIPAGATGQAMAQILVDAGVVKSVGAFTSAYTANPEAAGIQPGSYRLRLEMRADLAVAALLDSEKRVQTRVTFPEGQRVDQMLDKLSSVTTVSVADFQAAMADTAATGLPAEAGGSYEGWLYAATYSFEPGTTPTEMITRMVAETIRVLDERGVAPEDRQRVLTVASLVEREATTPEDRAKVARAIQNRLDIDMKLDIDAAVAYGAGISGLDLTTTELSADDPYNLYTRTGLPPTPIASPSLVSIDATLAPADGPWLFWVAVNLETGETLFTDDFTEHQANVQLLRQWQADNPSE